jgi:hypothetical protein
MTQVSDSGMTRKKYNLVEISPEGRGELQRQGACLSLKQAYGNVTPSWKSLNSTDVQTHKAFTVFQLLNFQMGHASLCPNGHQAT